MGAADVKTDLSASLNDFETAIQPIIGLKVGEIGRALPTQGPEKLPAEAKEKLAAAAPHQAIAKPKKPRKLLVMDLVVADGAHATIPYANYAIALMAKNTDAFQVVFSNDTDNLKYPKIKQFGCGEWLTTASGRCWWRRKSRTGCCASSAREAASQVCTEPPG